MYKIQPIRVPIEKPETANQKQRNFAMKWSKKKIKSVHNGYRDIAIEIKGIMNTKVNKN